MQHSVSYRRPLWPLQRWHVTEKLVVMMMEMVLAVLCNERKHAL
jgi:hypothetical protein